MNLDNIIREQKYWNETFESFSKKQNLTDEEFIRLHKFIDSKNKTIEDVINNNIKWDVPTKKYIKKSNGKKRIVYMFPIEQRILMGVLYRALSDFFADKLAENCFSYKKNISTIIAINYLQNKNNYEKRYAVKLDITAYFNSVPYERLQYCISELFKGYEESAIYQLIKQLYSINKCYEGKREIEEYMSLIPGTAIASLFANFFLVDIDNHFKASDSITYARYSDDIILFSKTKEKLYEAIDYTINEIQKYGLDINRDKLTYFNPEEYIQFLGLKFKGENIDISDEAVKKMKARIKKSVKQQRKLMELNGKSYKSACKSVSQSFNGKVYKCFILDKSKYGWGYYAFRFINTDESLKMIDFYMRDRLRWLKTGKNNSANIKKTSDEELESYGYVSMTMMYHLFKIDFDVYCDKVATMI